MMFIKNLSGLCQCTSTFLDTNRQIWKDEAAYRPSADSPPIRTIDIIPRLRFLLFFAAPITPTQRAALSPQTLPGMKLSRS